MKRLFYLLCIALTACSGDHDTAAPPQFSDQPWIYSEEFDANPRLYARDDQTLVVRIDDRLAASKSSLPGEQTVHNLPYYFDRDTDMTLTLDTNNPCIKSLRLADSATDNELFQINLQNPSIRMDIPRGSYTLTISEVTPLPDHCSSSFIYKRKSVESLPPVLEAGKKPFDSGEGIFRAFRLLQWQDTAKRMEFFNSSGYLLSLGDQIAGQPISAYNRYITGWKADLTFMGKKAYSRIPEDSSAPLKIGDPAHLMSLAPHDIDQKLYKLYAKALGPQSLYQGTIIAYSPNSGNNWHYGARTGCWAEEAGHGYATGDFTIQQTFHNGSVYGADYYKADRTKTRWSGTVQSFYENPYFDPYEFHISYDTGSMGGRTLALKQRNGSAGDNFVLTDVFYRNCWGWEPGNYSYTLGLKEIYRFYDKASDLGTIGKNEVVLYSGTNFTGQAVVFNTESPLPAVDFSGFTVSSIRVGHDATIKLFDKGRYQGNVAVVGIDIPTITNDARFKNLGPIQSLNAFRAIEVIVSNDCPGCNLQDVNLANHTLNNRDFRRTNFTRANLSNSSLINTILIDAVLQNARLDNANLKSANMCRAQLNKDPIQQKAATLNGAYLQNVNLAYAEMSGASFVNTNFHSMTTRDSCVPDINCKTTSCASAHKATMSNTDFTGAYLSGTDMSLATLTAAKFTNALALGVNFSNSNLSSDPTTGQSGAVFIGAFLFGANFNNAKMQGVQFSNAFFDDQVSVPTVKGVAVAHLGPYHTTFPGSPFQGGTVCPQYVVPIVTKAEYLPVTDHTVTCPNGMSGPCTGAQWKAAIAGDPSRFKITYGGGSPYPVPSLCTNGVYLLW